MFKLTDDRSVVGNDLRNVYVKALQDLIAENDKVVVLEADLGGASNFTKIGQSNPDNFIECGISEANMMGVAAGMSAEGFIPYVHTFAPFVARRAFDQLYLSGAYAKNTINFYGSDPGFCVAANGGTHTSWEDTAFMRTIPGAIVIDPADAVQLDWAVKAVAPLEGIHYIRANRKGVRNVYAEGSTFELGKGNVVREGSDVLIVAAGQLVSDALDAAEDLEKQGISAEVIDMFCIKPLDEELLLSEAAGKKAVVTFENHGVIGGLGDACASVLMENGVAVPFKRHGVVESFGQVGTADFLQKEFKLTAADLEDVVKSLL